MKVSYYIVAVLVCYSLLSFSDIKNSKELLVKNKVKSELEYVCSGSCSAQLTNYDKRGNKIAWNFFRLGTKYRYTYNENDELLETIWIDKSNTNDITIIPSNEHYYKFIEGKKYNQFIDNQNIITKIGDGIKRVEHYDSYCNLTFVQACENDEVIFEQTISYDTLQRKLKVVTIDIDHLESINSYRHDDLQFNQIVEEYAYNKLGQVERLNTYFSDPCMSFDNQFLYVYKYLENGLLLSADVYEQGKELAFELSFEYEYFE